MKAIKSDKAMSKKVVSFCEEEIRGDTAEIATKKSLGFSGKNRGVTPSVAALGVTHPSDATEREIMIDA